MLKKIFTRLMTVGTILLPLYLFLIRRWYLHWGATEGEIHRPLPGDEQIRRPRLETTRAVTINAAPAEIWPWIVQMGYGRAGWYTFDFIDNAGIPSANRIIPELQNVKAGDLIPTGPDGGFIVESIEPNRSLILAIHTASIPEAGADISSALILVPVNEQQTRLITRLRVDFKLRWQQVTYYLLFEPGDFVMTRKMLLGIKQRAEGVGSAALKPAGEAARG